MILKFDSTGLNTPGDIDYQGTGIIVTVDILVSPSTLGYYTFIENVGDVRIQTGDYLYQEDGIKKVVTSAQFQNNPQLKRLVTREIGEDLMESIIQGFIDLPVAFTDARKLSILITIGPVMNAIVANKLGFALAVANVIPTTADFTAGVKSAFIALITAAVAKL